MYHDTHSTRPELPLDTNLLGFCVCLVNFINNSKMKLIAHVQSVCLPITVHDHTIVSCVHHSVYCSGLILFTSVLKAGVHPGELPGNHPTLLHSSWAEDHGGGVSSSLTCQTPRALCPSFAGDGASTTVLIISDSTHYPGDHITFPGHSDVMSVHWSGPVEQCTP